MRREFDELGAAVMNGATLSQLREHENLIDVVARAVPEERCNLDTLEDINLYTRQGTVVPLSQVARVKYALEEPVLGRRNRDMAITVRADVKDGEQAVSVTREIRPLLEDIEARLPASYRIDVGGAVEGSTKANQALAAVVPALLVARAPLGFVAILGIIALCGMIRCNAVILVDHGRALVKGEIVFASPGTPRSTTSSSTGT